MANNESRQITSARSPYGELVRIRRGSSYARSADIDGWLSDKDVEILYKRWRKTWPTPISFRGGVLSITCDLVLEVGHKLLVKAYGVQRASRLINAAKKGSIESAGK